MKLGVSQLRLSAVVGVPLETLIRWEERRLPIPAEFLPTIDSTLEAFEKELLSRFIWSEKVEASAH